MNLGISRKKYDPCKMETILFHKEEWPHGRWTNRIDGHRGYTKIEFPLTYHTPYQYIYIWPIYIYISRDHDEVTMNFTELCEEIFLFFFSGETTWGTIETELWIKWTSERKWLNEMFDIPLDGETGVFERSAMNLPETEKRILINIGG